MLAAPYHIFGCIKRLRKATDGTIQVSVCLLGDVHMRVVIYQDIPQNISLLLGDSCLWHREISQAAPGSRATVGLLCSRTMAQHCYPDPQ